MIRYSTLGRYDEAMESKMKSLFSNTIFTFPDNAMFDSNSESKVKLPLISVYRLSNDVNFSDYNHSESFVGWRNSTNTRTKLIPIDLLYQIDIWSDNRNTADQLFSDLVFMLLTRPNITLDMKGTEDDKVFSMKLVDQSSTNNLPSQALSSNRIYRYSLTYAINNARLMYQDEVNIVEEILIDMDDSKDNLKITKE